MVLFVKILRENTSRCSDKFPWKRKLQKEEAEQIMYIEEHIIADGGPPLPPSVAAPLYKDTSNFSKTFLLAYN